MNIDKRKRNILILVVAGFVLLVVIIAIFFTSGGEDYSDYSTFDSGAREEDIYDKTLAFDNQELLASMDRQMVATILRNVEKYVMSDVQMYEAPHENQPLLGGQKNRFTAVIRDFTFIPNLERFSYRFIIDVTDGRVYEVLFKLDRVSFGRDGFIVAMKDTAGGQDCLPVYVNYPEWTDSLLVESSRITSDYFGTNGLGVCFQ